MREIRIAFLTFIASVSILKEVSAQGTSAENKIRLSIVTPENIDNLDDNQLSRLNSKFTDMVSSSGFAGDGALASSFVVYPKVLVNDVRVSDGGMFKIFAASINLTTVIMQQNTSTVFLSRTVELKGSGESQRLAIDNAIRSLNTNSREMSDFFANAKTKIVRYYSENCSDILKKGQTFMGQRSYDEAISLFFTVPSEVDCYDQVRPLIVNAYKQYQNQKCMEMLQVARAKYGSRDFSTALTYLAQIDPESKCHAESLKLINDCFRNISQEEARNFQFLKEAYKTEKALEARRIDAARDVAVAYYKSRPTRITYRTLVIY